MAQTPSRRLSTGRPMKTLFVENPGAGGGKDGPSLHRPAGVDRHQPANARVLVRKLASRYDRVVCLGGDGTVSAVVCGFVESGAQTSLGVVPGGTGNDFAAAIGVPCAPDACASRRCVARCEGGARRVEVTLLESRHKSVSPRSGIGVPAASPSVSGGAGSPFIRYLLRSRHAFGRDDGGFSRQRVGRV